MAPKPADNSLQKFIDQSRFPVRFGQRVLTPYSNRERRRNEEVANRMLGKNRHRLNKGGTNNPRGSGRRSKAPNGLGSRSSPARGLANRITKSTTPNRQTASRSFQRAIDSLGQDSGTPTTVSRPTDQTSSTNGAGGLRIKGRAGPFTVIAQNFLPSTSASDIEAAMFGDQTRQESGLISCRLITSKPTVIAELVFSKEHQAQNVIEQYNNKIADGRLLHVYMQNVIAGASRKMASTTASASADSQDDLDMKFCDKPKESVSGAQKNDLSARAPPTGPRGLLQDGRYGFPESAERASENGGGYNGSRSRDDMGTEFGRRSDDQANYDDRGYRQDRDRYQSYRPAREIYRPPRGREGRGGRGYGYGRGY